jgi:polysaccharide export outer membrane protein
MTDYAAGNHSKIVRSVNGRSSSCGKAANLVNKGDMSQNLELKAGDVLVVPESRL